MRITSKLATIVLTSGLAVSGLAAMAIPASADTAGGTTIANVGVDPAIAMTGLTGSFLLTGVPGTIATTGLTPVTMTVTTNNTAGYTVTVQSATDVMAAVDPIANTQTIPIADLTVRETGSGSYVPMTSAAATPTQAAVVVHRQTVRSAETGDTVNNDYQITIPFVNADTYTATLDYVATTL